MNFPTRLPLRPGFRRFCGVSLVSLCLLASTFPGYSQVDADTDVAQQHLRRITEDWADLQKSFKESDMLDNVIAGFERTLESHSESIMNLPDTNPQKAEMMAALTKIQTEFPVQAKAAQGALEARHLTEYWERDSMDSNGWEAEQSATFASMLKMQSQAMSRLGMPLTAGMHQNASRFLERTKPETDDAAVKALLDKITKIRDTTRAKIVSAAGKILDEAGKMTLNEDSRNRLESFGQSDLSLALGEAPELAALQQRAVTTVAAYDKAAGGAKAEVEKLSAGLNEQSRKVWPKLVESVKTTTEFDAGAALKDPGSLKGKRILFSGVNNRMGWDFKPGEYDFALHKNGTAVVGKYDAAVRTVVEDTKKRLRLNALPEEEYDIIAEVAGTAKATVFQDVEGDVKVQGSSETLKVTGRKEVKEDAVLLHIIGLRVGPVAVVAGEGAVQADGTITAVAAPAGVSSSGGSFLVRLGWCVLGLAAGLLVLIHARFPALANLGPVQKLQPKLTPPVLTAAGLFFIVAGLVLLVKGMVIYGLLMSLAFILAGLFLSLDFFTSRKWLPEHLATHLRTRGTLAGVAAVAIALLYLVVAGRMVVI